jgi:predicted MPP superfamily phosphohydrolase
MKAFIRKHWLRLLIWGGMGLCALDGFVIEPRWIKCDRLSLSDRPTMRVVHISDIHYKGDRAYLLRIIATVNQLAPDVVCFTGDIVENTHYLDEALDALSKINVPLYGVPGNHDYWSGASFERIGTCFQGTGGGWLLDNSVSVLKGRLLIVGSSGSEIETRGDASEFAMPGRRMEWNPMPNIKADLPNHAGTAGSSPSAHGSNPPVGPEAKRILLAHHPAAVDSIKGERYDLILSGHAHGGQVRLPLFGALVVPYGVNGYQLGTYSTPAGRLHVSAGLGTFLLPVRFLCRPEITVIEL